MSYATMAAFRIILPEAELGDAMTRILQSYLDRGQSVCDVALGFRYDGPQVTKRLDGDGEYELYLPAPGASSIPAVTENGVALTTADWELDALEGRYLTRLDVSGAQRAWPDGLRNIAVTYVPAACPPWLVEAELEIATAMWRGKTSAYSGVIGVEGSNDLMYVRALPPMTKFLFEETKRKFQRAPGMGGD